MGFKLWGVISVLCLLLCLLICFKIPNGLNMFPLFFSGGLKKKKEPAGKKPQTNHKVGSSMGRETAAL